jgi:transcription elongation GreA/GreB family factor
VEESVTRICNAFGAVRVDVFIITSSMVVTVHTKDGETHTQTRRIMSSGVNIEKIHRLNQLSREICEKNLSVEEIEAKLKNCEVIEMTNTDTVQLGSKLKYLDVEEGEEYEFTIVGTAEADFSKGKISIESPVGQALNGKKAGDVVTVKAPKGGDYQIKILEILD